MLIIICQTMFASGTSTAEEFIPFEYRNVTSPTKTHARKRTNSWKNSHFTSGATFRRRGRRCDKRGLALVFRKSYIALAFRIRIMVSFFRRGIGPTGLVGS